HVLVMSATPIPRTLTMTIYGDLDVSIIDTLPSNRIPIKTYLRGDSRLDKIYEFIKSEVDKGNQAFIVYPLVEDSDKLNLKSAEEYYKKLSEDVFSNYNVGLIHGKMKWQDKENVMLEFANKKFDILISTTVIEVGIDIPDATVIVINDAYRFGLSQLHQLRGRIGRSNKQSYCILVAEDGIIKSNYTKDISLEYLSKSEIEKYKSAIRLQSMVKYNDGFKLSEIDLKLRGPGNIFGKEQSGFPELKHANIIDDSELLFKSKTCAFDIVKNDPKLSLPHNKLIKSVLLRDYQNHLIFSGIA
ncbi:MAG: DNA helicase RecG, partial [Ignavibacteria bacterium]